MHERPDHRAQERIDTKQRRRNPVARREHISANFNKWWLLPFGILTASALTALNILVFGSFFIDHSNATAFEQTGSNTAIDCSAHKANDFSCELLGLRWEDVNLEQGLLHVRQALAPDGKSFSQPKSAKGRRRIRLTPEAVDALKRHKVAQNEERLRQGSLWRDHGLVFCSSVGTPMNPENFIKRSYKPLLKRAELPQIPFHCLRHTFATLMMPNGHPKIVQEMLGHTRISTTLDVYSHVSPDMQDEAVKRFGMLFP
jgi:hypothetical protein